MYEVIRTVYRAFDVHPNSTSDAGASRVAEAIVVHCRKPSAVTFAAASGVEMTRTRTPETSWVSSEKVDLVSRFDVDHEDLQEGRDSASQKFSVRTSSDCP